MPRILTVALGVLALASNALPQVATGSPPFGSAEAASFDKVNLANLNVQFSIPIINKQGRGLPLRYALQYNSSIWTPGTKWQPSSTWGWGGDTDGIVGLVVYNSWLGNLCKAFGVHYYYGWTYIDPHGTPHNFGLPVYSTSAGCNMPTSATGVATDGSGYTMHVTASPPSAIVYPPSGGSIIAPLLNPSTPGTYTTTDPNGNQITVVNSGSTRVITDTLGTNALTITGTPPNMYTYYAPSGAQANVKVNYSTYTVRTNFSAKTSAGVAIAEYGPATVSLISSIVLPDGTSYAFTYEPTPGYTGDVTGRIASVTLPSGGTTTYNYSGGYNGIWSDGSTPTLNRGTPDAPATSGHYWTYTTSGPSFTTQPANHTTTVTTPDANQMLLSFSGLYETQRQIYQGSTSGTLLKTVLKCYNGNFSNCATASVSIPPTSIYTYTELPGPSGKWNCHAEFYDQVYGNLTGTQDFDFGQGTNGPMLTQTSLTYDSSLNNNIVDRPSSVVVKDGSGNIQAQTNYYYDTENGNPGATVSGVTSQHVSVSGSRGNLEEIDHYLSSFGNSCTASSICLKENFTYYDTGTLYTHTDINRTTPPIATAVAGAPAVGTAAGTVSTLTINIAARAYGWAAAFGGGTGVVLGKFDELTNYVEAAESIGANALNASPRAFSFFSNAGQWWTVNQSFLQASVWRGQQFYMSSPVLGADGGFARELEYLISRGIGPDQWQMVRLPY